MKRAALFFAVVLALPAGDEKPARPELPPPVRAVVELARAAPPEFFAKTIADLIEEGKIPDRESRIDLVEEAFAVAAEAKQPYRLAAIPATPQDTRAIYRSKAGELRLDALSLRSRLVREMAAIDPARARARFDHVEHTPLDPRPCSDPLVADLSAYYEMAGAIAQSSFTAAEKAKNAQVGFLEAVLDGARSPGELLPFVQMLKSVELPPAQKETLAGALAAKLVSIGADYRPFAMTFPALETEIGSFGSDDLKNAFAGFAAAQARAPRCAPDFPVRITVGDEEVRPSRVETGFNPERYFQSGAARQIMEGLTRLRNLSPRDRQEGFSNRVADFLRDFGMWNPAGDGIDVFHQRATVFRALLEITPRGEDRDRVLALAVSLLGSSTIERDDPAEWWYEVNVLLQGPGFDAARTLDLFRASGSAGLALYAITLPGT